MTNRLGLAVLRLETVSSTNDVARELAASGATEGLCIIAGQQTAGRGRQGRSWASAPGDGLYLSVILRPTVPASNSPVITLAAAVAVAETLISDFKIDAEIKWPNDVLVRGRKICGILVESAIEGNHLSYAVMGIGINILQRAFPDSIGTPATSVFLETGSEVTIKDLIAFLLPKLDRWYRASQSRADDVLAKWQELSPMSRNCRVVVEMPEGNVEGITRGLLPGGALDVELANGVRRAIVAGDVRVRETARP